MVSARKTSIACCVGDRWRLRISSANGLKRNCYARRWLRAESTERLLVHGLRERVWVCCGKRRWMEVRSDLRRIVKGGMGGLSEALASAAKAAGVEIRTSAQRLPELPESMATTPKVVLEGGEEIESRVVVSNADPRTTFLNLVDPIDLDPNFLLKMRNYRAPGVAAKINLALIGLAGISRCKRRRSESKTCRPHSHRSRDRLSRARFRRFEVWRVFCRTVSRHHHSVARAILRSRRRANT